MSLPSWLDPRKENNRRSAKQERDHAKATGGRRQAGSGSSWRAPQDTRNEHYLDQLKLTSRDHITIKRLEWEALRSDALRAGLEPRLIIAFQQGGVTIRTLEITERGDG